MVTGMDMLDDAIADVAYILDSLRVLRKIYESGHCTNCKVSNVCKVKPKAGQMVRYNCPFYEKDGDGEEKE